VSTHRDIDRIVRSWLEEGVTALPDRVLDVVLDELPATRQRALGRIGRWFPVSLRFAAATLGAAVTVALGVGLLGSVSGIHLGSAPETSALPTSYPVLTHESDLPAGRYAVPDTLGVPITLQVPAGWSNCSHGAEEVGVCRGAGTVSAGVTFLVVADVLEDPCEHTARSGPSLGPGVDDLVQAIIKLDGFTSTEPEATTVDGYPAQRLTVKAPTQYVCTDSGDGLGTWATRSRVNGVGLGETNELRVLEVNGVRVLIAAAYPSTAGQATQDEIRDVLDSVRVGR